jgi:hypothetical protein
MEVVGSFSLNLHADELLTFQEVADELRLIGQTVRITIDRGDLAAARWGPAVYFVDLSRRCLWRANSRGHLQP